MDVADKLAAPTLAGVPMDLVVVTSVWIRAGRPLAKRAIARLGNVENLIVDTVTAGHAAPVLETHLRQPTAKALRSLGRLMFVLFQLLFF